MKQFYSNRLFPKLKKSLLLALIFLGASSVSSAQVYWVALSGPAEAPPNTSPGTGKALVTIDATAGTMRLQTSFSGLLGNVTIAHIHAPTAVAGTGAVGVATRLPTFPGFPSGVTAGSYDQTLNMLQAGSYNPAYITANGGTPASAFAALLTAINAGKAYLNIHSTMFPGGEIRGFLTACPGINVTIPDAFALPQGTLANTVYPAYAPANSLTLQTNVSGGMGSYTYNWSNGATTASTTVSPSVTTAYSVTVRDANGCPGMATKTVNVVNVSGGQKGDKIIVCHNGKNELTIAAPAVADHLLHGDMLGRCEPITSTNTRRSADFQAMDLAIKVLANPSATHFDVQLRSGATENVRIMVYDNLGRLIETKSSLAANQTLRLGSSYKPGTYLVQIIQGGQKQTLKLIKTN